MAVKRQAAGLRALALAGAKATRAAFRRRGFAEARVLTRWPAIVGADLAACSCPERLSFPPGQGTGGTLHLRVVGGFAIELQHLEPLVVERINTYFGFPAVARLALMQGPLPPPPRSRRGRGRPLRAAEEAALGESVADTADAELRAALHDLGRRVTANNPAPERAEHSPPGAPAGGEPGQRREAPGDRS